MIAFDQWCRDVAKQIFEFRDPQLMGDLNTADAKKERYIIAHTRYLLFRKSVFFTLCSIGNESSSFSSTEIKLALRRDPIGFMYVMSAMSTWFYRYNQDPVMKVLGGVTSIISLIRNCEIDAKTTEEEYLLAFPENSNYFKSISGRFRATEDYKSVEYNNFCEACISQLDRSDILFNPDHVIFIENNMQMLYRSVIKLISKTSVERCVKLFCQRESIQSDDLLKMISAVFYSDAVYGTISTDYSARIHQYVASNAEARVLLSYAYDFYSKESATSPNGAPDNSFIAELYIPMDQRPLCRLFNESILRR